MMYGKTLETGPFGSFLLDKHRDARANEYATLLLAWLSLSYLFVCIT